MPGRGYRNPLAKGRRQETELPRPDCERLSWVIPTRPGLNRDTPLDGMAGILLRRRPARQARLTAELCRSSVQSKRRHSDVAIVRGVQVHPHLHVVATGGGLACAADGTAAAPPRWLG